MAKVAALVGLLVLTTIANARADPNCAVWRIAQKRTLTKWGYSEPKCGWTVGGYTCAPPMRAVFGWQGRWPVFITPPRGWLIKNYFSTIPSC